MDWFFRIGKLLLLIHLALQKAACEDTMGVQGSATPVLPNISANDLAGLSAVQEAEEERFHSTDSQPLVDPDPPSDEDGMLESLREKARSMSLHSNYNVGILIDLARNISNPSEKSDALTYLYFEATEHNHVSTLNLIRLAKALSEKGGGFQFDRVINTVSLKKLLDQIAAQTTAILVDALTSGESYQENAEARALAEGIADWRGVSTKVMTDFVSGVVDSIDRETILQAVVSHTDVWQALVGLDCLIQKINSWRKVSTSTAFAFASHLEEITSRGTLHDIELKRAAAVKAKLPACIMNLASPTEFCIRNTNNDSLLLSIEEKYGREHRNVVAGPRLENGTVQGEAKWRLERIGESLFFESVHYPTEKLYTMVDSAGFQRLFGSVPDGDVGQKYAWILELDGKSCFFKNAEVEKYLYESSYKVDQTQNKFVLLKAEKEGLGEKQSPFLWQIERC